MYVVQIKGIDQPLRICFPHILYRFLHDGGSNIISVDWVCQYKNG